jgi:hypothetical protein
MTLNLMVRGMRGVDVSVEGTAIASTAGAGIETGAVSCAWDDNGTRFTSTLMPKTGKEEGYRFIMVRPFFVLYEFYQMHSRLRHKYMKSL